MKLEIHSIKECATIGFIVVFLSACGGLAVTDSASTVPRNVARSINPPSSLLDNGDGTVTDTKTGLVWQKADSTTGMTRDEAKTYCAELVIGSREQWRLPTSGELTSLYYNAGGEMLDRPKLFYWSGLAYWGSDTGASSDIGIAVLFLKSGAFAMGWDINSKHFAKGEEGDDSPMVVRAVHD